MEAGFQKLREYLIAPKTGAINEEKRQQVLAAYDIVRDIILPEDPDAIIEVVEGALQLGDVVIEVTTSDVTVYDTAMFAEATNHASNFQAYPTADGRIKLDILFEGVIDYTLL